jgi:DNA polymerase-3 subunit beta
MYFSCEKNILVEALSGVSRSVAVKSNIPALEGVHVTVKNDFAELESYNMEFGVKTKINVSDAKEGSMVIPAKIFTEIARKLPEGMIEVNAEKFEVEISCGSCRFSISGFDSKDFPNLPDVEDEKFINLPADILQSMIRQTIFAVSTDSENRGIHSGTLVEVKDKFLTFVSVDGFRLALRRRPTDVDYDFKLVVPGKALNELMRLLPNDESSVKIFLSERYIFFETGKYTLLSRLLEGDFIDYQSTIPQESSTQIKLKAKSMISALERVALVISDRLKNPVKAVAGDNKIEFSCFAALGRSNDEIEASVQGEALEIAFNDRFMIDALKNTETDMISVEMTTSFKPIKITPLEGDSFLFLVLPVRLRDDDNTVNQEHENN